MKRLLFLLALLASGCGGQSLAALGTDSPQPAETIAAGNAPPWLPGVALIARPAVQVSATATPQPLGDRSIYVLDPRNGDLVSQILVINPDARRVVTTLRARYTPDLAFSPDGRLLFVADTYWTQVTRGEPRDVLSAYDASSGELLGDEVEIPERLKNKIFPQGSRNLFLSHDGRRLFVRKYGAPEVHTFRLAVLDAATFETLAEYPACANGRLWPLPDDRLVCADTGGIRIIDPLTGATLHELTLPSSRSGTPAIALAGYRMYLVTRDAHVSVVDFAPSSPQVSTDRVALDAPPGSAVGYNHIALTPDGSRLYLGFMSGEGRYEGLADEIWAFDTSTWARVGAFEPTDPAFHLAVSADGQQLYTVNPFAQSLAILNTRTFREVGVLRELGDTPALIAVPPSR